MNDLEPPAFGVLPELKNLKERLAKEGGASFKAVFMSGSGSTICAVGSDVPPSFLANDPSLFVAPARLITRKKGEWYAPVLKRAAAS